jgi:hypothetical protein
MNMSFNEVSGLILGALQERDQLYGQSWILGKDLRIYKENQGYISGMNCNGRGYDVHDYSKDMHRNGVITRFKKHPTPKAQVYYVLAGFEAEFLAAHPGVVEDHY